MHLYFRSSTLFDLVNLNYFHFVFAHFTFQLKTITENISVIYLTEKISFTIYSLPSNRTIVIFWSTFFKKNWRKEHLRLSRMSEDRRLSCRSWCLAVWCHDKLKICNEHWPLRINRREKKSGFDIFPLLTIGPPTEV